MGGVNNPLIEPILAILRTTPEGISEHALISRLESEAGICFTDRRQDNLALFQTHFMVMNALYQLRDRLAAEYGYLAISPLSIKIEPLRQAETAGLPASESDANLRHYYLEWQNLEGTTGDDVDELLGSFWQRFYAFDRQPEALDCLGLAADAAWPEIQQTYRRLAARHHPDKGGDEAHFIEIRGAFELLRRCRSPQVK